LFFYWKSSQLSVILYSKGYHDYVTGSTIVARGIAMIIEPLSTEKLKEGIFCPAGDPDADGMYEHLGAWLSGEMLCGQVARSESNDVYGFILYYPMSQLQLRSSAKGFTWSSV
jgi:hypothetical protein